MDVFPAAKCVALAEDFSKYGSGQRFVFFHKAPTKYLFRIKQYTADS